MRYAYWLVLVSMGCQDATPSSPSGAESGLEVDPDVVDVSGPLEIVDPDASPPDVMDAWVEEAEDAVLEDLGEPDAEEPDVGVPLTGACDVPGERHCLRVPLGGPEYFECTETERGLVWKSAACTGSNIPPGVEAHPVCQEVGDTGAICCAQSDWLYDPNTPGVLCSEIGDRNCASNHYEVMECRTASLNVESLPVIAGCVYWTTIGECQSAPTAYACIESPADVFRCDAYPLFSEPKWHDPRW